MHIIIAVLTIQIIWDETFKGCTQRHMEELTDLNTRVTVLSKVAKLIRLRRRGSEWQKIGPHSHNLHCLTSQFYSVIRYLAARHHTIFRLVAHAGTLIQHNPTVTNTNLVTQRYKNGYCIDDVYTTLLRHLTQALHVSAMIIIIFEATRLSYF